MNPATNDRDEMVAANTNYRGRTDAFSTKIGLSSSAVAVSSFSIVRQASRFGTTWTVALAHDGKRSAELS
jgi:hypothetical protein